MRLCDFLMKIKGDFNIKIYSNNETKIKEGNINELNKEQYKSFDPLDGFTDELWEKLVKDWIVNNSEISILVK